MTVDLVVTVLDNGTVEVRRRDNDATTQGTLRLDQLESRLIRLFERWLSERDRSWRRDEIVVFGSFLHRALLADVWGFVAQQIAGLGDDDVLRLNLVFPAERDGHLATIPWEYLYAPEGWFVATHEQIVLSRYMPSPAGIRSLRLTEPTARMLVVVSRPEDLGPVNAEPVLEEVERLGQQLGVQVTVELDPTVARLETRLREVRPHIVHFMGHGQYVDEREEGQLAFVNDQGLSHWVSDRDLATLLTRGRNTPRLVMLHSCEGARTDYRADFAGLAPQLVRAGVQCVVAMQYAVTNRVATEFSRCLYEEVAQGRGVDVAVQEGRWRIAGPRQADPEPHLLGVPVVYLNSTDATLIDPAVTKVAG